MCKLVIKTNFSERNKKWFIHKDVLDKQKFSTSKTVQPENNELTRCNLCIDAFEFCEHSS